MHSFTRQAWAHRVVLASTLAIGLFVPPATGQEAANAGKSQGPVVILPSPGAAFGMVETAPGSLHLPGKEYRAGEGWWALSCSATCKLFPTRLSVAPKAHPQYDGEPVPGQWLTFTPAPPAQTLMVFKPYRAPADQLALRAGPVPTYYPGLLHKLKRSTGTAGTMEGEIALADGRMARLVPTVLLPNPKQPPNPDRESTGFPLVLDLVLDGKRQSLGAFSFGIEGNGGVKPQEYLRWAGDLDGDGQLDLVVRLDFSSGTEYVLWLSSMAKPGELVGFAGSFHYWPIDISGC